MARGFATCQALVISCPFGDPIAQKLLQISVQGLTVERHLIANIGSPLNLLNQVTLVWVAACDEIERRHLPTRDVH